MNRVFLNDSIQDSESACISVNDSGLLYGAGLFENMRAHNGVIFAAQEHIERLEASATALGIPCAYDAKYMIDAAYRILQANELSEARLRLTITSGRMGQDDVPRTTLLITAVKFEAYPEETYKKGAAVVLCPFRQNPADPVTGHQVLNYLSRLLALNAARAKAASESLWFTVDNRLAEGCFSNVFLVKKGKLMTPPLSTPVVPGIVRKHVCRIAAGQGIEVVEEDIVISDLLGAEEVFVTSTNFGVLPVVRVEAHEVGSGKVGEVTTKLMQGFSEYFEQACRQG